MRKENDLFRSKRKRVMWVSLVVILAAGILAYACIQVRIRQDDQKIQTVLKSLTYRESNVEEELAQLQPYADNDFVSDSVQGQLFQALAEVSYMGKDEMLYNKYVADAQYFLEKTGNHADVVYITNKFMGRLYANGCYDAASSLMRDLARNNDIDSLPIATQAAYYLSVADLNEMTHEDPSSNLNQARLAIETMEPGGERDINQAKLDLLTARDAIQQNDMQTAKEILSAYQETDDFGFGNDQVYVICDFQLPYWELMSQVYLQEGAYVQAFHCVDSYIQQCDQLNFRTMKLRVLQETVDWLNENRPEEGERYASLVQKTLDENLKVMTEEYGTFLLKTMSIEKEEIQRIDTNFTRRIRVAYVLLVVLYGLIMVGCLGSGFLDVMSRDGLTKLNNRRKFDELRGELEAHKVPYGLILFDIDDFKKVNDTCGHAVGDSVLANISSILLSYCGRGVAAFRYGGEELCLILEGVPKNRVIAIAEEIRLKVQSTIQAGDKCVTVSGGVGISHAGENVFIETDQNLYRAKGSGKNQICTSDQKVESI